MNTSVNEANILVCVYVCNVWGVGDSRLHSREDKFFNA
jgi:hypothetical protein